MSVTETVYIIWPNKINFLIHLLASIAGALEIPNTPNLSITDMALTIEIMRRKKRHIEYLWSAGIEKGQCWMGKRYFSVWKSVSFPEAQEKDIEKVRECSTSSMIFLGKKNT